MKYLRDRFRAVLRLDDPPHTIALAFGLGVFVAFTPTIGLHTISCFLLAWAFRVSKLVTLTGSFLMNPWTMVPLYGFCLWLGIKMTGSTASAPAIAWNELTFMNAFGVIKPYLWPFVAGTISVGVLAAVLAYFLVRWAVVRYRAGEER